MVVVSILNMVYDDLIQQYNQLNEDEVKSLLIYKTSLYNLINYVSTIDHFLELDDQLIVNFIDKDIFINCEKFGEIINRPENVFLKLSLFKDIDFNNHISLVSMAKKVYIHLQNAMDKIKLSDDLIVYRVVSLDEGEELSNLSRGDLVSTSIDIDEALKFAHNNCSKIVLYKITLNKDTPVLVTPYSIVNEYENEMDMILKTSNYRLGLYKTVHKGQMEVIFSKNNLDIEIVEIKNKKIDNSLICYYQVNTKMKDDYKFHK